MAKSYRKARLNESIKELLSEIILTELKDPRLGLATVTSVRVSADLTVAKVYVSIMEEDKRESSLEGLQSAKNFLRRTVGRELKMRNTPELHFVYDDSLDRSFSLEEKLKEINIKDDDAEN